MAADLPMPSAPAPTTPAPTTPAPTLPVADDPAPAAASIPAPILATLEFTLPPDQAARLARAAPLAGLRAGRAVSRELRILWHDTAARTLAGRGLALAEEAGAWRLERATPDDAADATSWLPATPAPVLARAEAPSALSAVPTEGLMPVAGFAGRARLAPLAFPNGPGSLLLLEGSLRGVAADKPECRLQLSGPAGAVSALAARLGEGIDLMPPLAGLAAAALAVAAGQPPAPRHLGAPAIAPGLSVEQALVRITAHLADTILYWAPSAPLGEAPEPVHQMRVAVRRLRSALAFFRRATPGAEARALSAELRDLAACLGAARDWDVFLGGAGADVGTAFAGDRRVAGLLAAAARKREAAYQVLRARLASPGFRALALRLALLPTSRPWRSAEADATVLAAHAEAFASHVLDRRLKQLLAPGPDLSALSADAQHELRKDAKRLRYAAEFAAPLFGQKKRRRFLDRLADLQEALGAVNDAHVTAALMAELPGGADRAFASGAVLGYVSAAGRKRAAEAGRAWRKLIEEPPFWH